MGVPLSYHAEGELKIIVLLGTDFFMTKMHSNQIVLELWGLGLPTPSKGTLKIFMLAFLCIGMALAHLLSKFLLYKFRMFSKCFLCCLTEL